MKRRGVFLVLPDPLITADWEARLGPSYEIGSARGVLPAAARLAEGVFHAVVAKAPLPGFSAAEILRAVGLVNPRIPVILIFDPAEREAAMCALDLGAFAVLFEPVSIKILLARVEHAVGVVNAREAMASVVRDTRNELLFQTVAFREIATFSEIAKEVSAELESPLQALEMCVTALRGIAPEYGGVEEETVEEMGSHVKMAQDILRHFSGRRDERKEDPAVHYLRDLVEPILGMFRAPLREQGIGLVMEIPDGLEVRVHQDRLDRVLINLITNAGTAFGRAADGDEKGPPKEIRFRASRNGEEIFLDISDTGPGVPAGIAGALFDPFVSSKTEGSVKGLGLHLSRLLVEGMGGRIHLRDTGPSGTTFRIHLAPGSRVPSSSKCVEMGEGGL